MYSLKTEQVLNISLEEAWDFFSSPRNLQEITPKDVGFNILSDLPEKMYPGMIVRYKISPIKGLSFAWTTEITQVRELNFFIDTQITGPYKIWHHQHHFTELEARKVLVKDIVHYVPPFGVLGKVLQKIYIGKRVKEIFDFRHQYLERKFNQ